MSLFRKLRKPSVCLAFFDMLSMGVCITKALAEVRSAVAGINCMHSMCYVNKQK